MVPNEITVLFAGCIEARVEIRRATSGRNHTDVVRQMGIDGERQLGHGHFELSTGNFEVRDHAERVHPVYFEFPFQRSDDVTIDLPLGWQISTVPKPENLDAKAVTYTLEAKNDKGTLHLNRALNVDILMLPAENYATLRKIFQIVRTVDEQQVILQPNSASASN